MPCVIVTCIFIDDQHHRLKYYSAGDDSDIRSAHA